MSLVRGGGWVGRCSSDGVWTIGYTKDRDTPRYIVTWRSKGRRFIRHWELGVRAKSEKEAIAIAKEKWSAYKDTIKTTDKWRAQRILPGDKWSNRIRMTRESIRKSKWDYDTW